MKKLSITTKILFLALLTGQASDAFGMEKWHSLKKDAPNHSYNSFMIMLNEQVDPYILKLMFGPQKFLDLSTNIYDIDSSTNEYYKRYKLANFLANFLYQQKNIKIEELSAKEWVEKIDAKITTAEEIEQNIPKLLNVSKKVNTTIRFSEFEIKRRKKTLSYNSFECFHGSAFTNVQLIYGEDFNEKKFFWEEGTTNHKLHFADKQLIANLYFQREKGYYPKCRTEETSAMDLFEEHEQKILKHGTHYKLYTPELAQEFNKKRQKNKLIDCVVKTPEQ